MQSLLETFLRSPRKSTVWYTRINRNRPCICWTKWCQGSRVQQSKHSWYIKELVVQPPLLSTLQPAMRLAWLDWRGNGDQAGEEDAMLIVKVRHRSRGGRFHVNRCDCELLEMDKAWGGGSGRGSKGRASPSTRKSTCAPWYSCGKETIEYRT